MKFRKRIVAVLAAVAISCLGSGIGVAVTSSPATAVTVHKTSAVASSYQQEIYAIKKIAAEHAFSAISTPQLSPPTTYTVASGDYLSTISARLSGSAGNWPALWYVNKTTVPNPDALSVGQVLTLPTSWTVPPWMLQQALAAIPSSAPVQTTAYVSQPSAPAAPTGSLQAYALQLLGGDQTQFSCLNSIIMRESSWNVYAYNPSGAYGIPQALPGSKMAAAGSDWASDGYTQLRWMIQMYIPGTYGTACNAWAHEQAYGSY